MATKKKRPAKKTAEVIELKKSVPSVIPPLDHDPTDKDPLDYWVLWVGASFGKSVQSIIETGVWLYKLKHHFKDEGLKAVEDRLKIPMSTISKLRSIGAHTVLTDFSHVKNLPASYTTLYELSQFPPDALRAKLKNGEVHAGLERKDAVKLRKGGKAGDRKSPEIETDPEPRSAKDAWEILVDGVENFYEEQYKKARAEFTLEEFGKAEPAIESAVATLSKLRLNLQDLIKDKNIVTTHVPPRSRRRTR
jgi:hypothetical protein